MTALTFAIVAVEDGATVLIADSALTDRQRDAVVHIVRHRGVDALPAAPAQEAATPTPRDATRPQALTAAAARAQGFSGDICGQCGSAAMLRAGTCLACQACGSTTGCS